MSNKTDRSYSRLFAAIRVYSRLFAYVAKRLFAGQNKARWRANMAYRKTNGAARWRSVGGQHGTQQGLQENQRGYFAVRRLVSDDRHKAWTFDFGSAYCSAACH